MRFWRAQGGQIEQWLEPEICGGDRENSHLRRGGGGAAGKGIEEEEEGEGLKPSFADWVAS